jgi:putative endonuclease
LDVPNKVETIPFDITPQKTQFSFAPRIVFIAREFLALSPKGERLEWQELLISSMAKGGAVYIVTNKHHIVFYTGVTSDLLSRINQHRNKFYPKSFTARYNIYKLIYYELHSSIVEAIDREKVDKDFSRDKKFGLVERMNPAWRDLYEDIKDW